MTGTATGVLAASGIMVRLGGREVLRGVDFAVTGGKLVGIVGPNGAGKSTLARVLAGVLVPHQGRVMLADASIHRRARGGVDADGRGDDAGAENGGGFEVLASTGDEHPSRGEMAAGVRQHDSVVEERAPYTGHGATPLASLRPAVRARAVAYLPQGATLAWPLTVTRLAGLGRLPHLGPLSRTGVEDTAAIERAMARADVLHLRDRIATELSGGERARALLARALAVEARVLIADEPLAALDPGHALGVMELLREEARRGVAVVAVMHELTLAARFCDRLVLLDAGRVVADGVPEEVLGAANLRAVYGVEAWTEEVGGQRLIVPLSRVAFDATDGDARPRP